MNFWEEGIKRANASTRENRPKPLDERYEHIQVPETALLAANKHVITFASMVKQHNRWPYEAQLRFKPNEYVRGFGTPPWRHVNPRLQNITLRVNVDLDDRIDEYEIAILNNDYWEIRQGMNLHQSVWGIVYCGVRCQPFTFIEYEHIPISHLEAILGGRLAQVMVEWLRLRSLPIPS